MRKLHVAEDTAIGPLPPCGVPEFFTDRPLLPVLQSLNADGSVECKRFAWSRLVSCALGPFDLEEDRAHKLYLVPFQFSVLGRMR